ncbi:aryl-sulfate sulfotransferase [Phreatobacter cathodiphilus]|uniref:Aryl-sulfate sulfotransferase n=1 Tax=Phreatobacter cathodiphilus TaxID=1868589 RepID=A0A2S0NE36_9HYPH|nr:aryl-sulfate sulfotransferase [Phreatobacter cathodiphilus]
MTSALKKRSAIIGGQKSSVSLEDDFWNAFVEIADARQMTLSDLLTAIDDKRRNGNLSSAVRVFVLQEVLAGRLGPKPAEPPPRRYRRVSASLDL